LPLWQKTGLSTVLRWFGGDEWLILSCRTFVWCPIVNTVAISWLLLIGMGIVRVLHNNRNCTFNKCQELRTSNDIIAANKGADVTLTPVHIVFKF